MNEFLDFQRGQQGSALLKPRDRIFLLYIIYFILDFP